MPENGLLPENSPIPNAQGIVAQEAPASEVASMLPHESVQPDGMQSLFEAPYGLPGMGSAGFQSQSYALSQLGNLFQPAQSLPVSGPGLSCLYPPTRSPEPPSSTWLNRSMGSSLRFQIFVPSFVAL